MGMKTQQQQQQQQQQQRAFLVRPRPASARSGCRVSNGSSSRARIDHGIYVVARTALRARARTPLMCYTTRISTFDPYPHAGDFRYFRARPVHLAARDRDFTVIAKTFHISLHM